MATVAELAGVTIKRGNNVLLDHISLIIHEDERWVVVGPNGAGKTTLLQVLSAQMYPSDGVVGLLGEVIGAVDVFELRPRIGFTSLALADRIPGREKVRDVVLSAAYGVIGRWREEYDVYDEARADDLLASLRVNRLAERTFGTLSEGERKRVQIARALMTDPEMLLLDEPASGLDIAGREVLVDTLSEICTDEDSPATILVTHQLEEIPEGITHALLLKDGRIVAAGPIDETLTDENLSRTYDMDLTVNREDGRWTARSARRG